MCYQTLGITINSWLKGLLHIDSKNDVKQLSPLVLIQDPRMPIQKWEDLTPKFHL